MISYIKVYLFILTLLFAGNVSGEGLINWVFFKDTVDDNGFKDKCSNDNQCPLSSEGETQKCAYITHFI